MRETEFINLFQFNRPNEVIWKEIATIQTAIKSKTGCGTPVYVEFTAPLCTARPDAIIDYGLDRYPSDYSLLKSGDDYHYALKQCSKIASWI